MDQQPNDDARDPIAHAARASAELRRIRLAIPQQHALVGAMETLRLSSVGRAAGEATRGLRVIQPTGCGKSEAAKEFVRFVEAQPGRDPGTKPVLHVTLGTQGTPRSFATSCLSEFRNGQSLRGTEEVLLERLRVAIEEDGVEVLVIDELNHCAGKTMGRDISNTLKNIMTRGWVPIVFLGTEDADSLFRGNRELRIRCKVHGAIRPLDPHADLDVWMQFACGMEEQMLERGLIGAGIGLDDEAVAEALCVACSGRIGELVNVLDDALVAALTAGRDAVAVADLERAVETRFVLEGEIEANPLRDLSR